MEEDDLSYLEPDFNPASLTVARLRNVLLTHGINYPSSAKKGDLVQIFTDELKPRARKILSAQKRIQRSSRGIEDAASSVASTLDADEDGAASQPSPVKRGRGRPKKTEKAPEDDETDHTLVTPAAPSTAKKSRSRPAKSVERKSIQRTSSATTPSTLKRDESDPTTWRQYGKDSPFSADNPFQSGGSSPPQPPASIKRRKTDGHISGDEKKKRASASRRKTDKTSVVQHSNTVVNVPISATTGSDQVEAGEEFEPSELAELELERRSGNTAVVPVRRSSRGTGSGIVLPSIFSTLVAFLGVFGYFWAQEKFQVGYCGIGHPSDAISGIEIPEWADVLRPTCEPCPQHGICFHNLRIECEKDFILKQNPLSLGGILPFTPTCEPDGEKPKRVKVVADRVVEELREHKAQAECSGTDKEGKPIESPEITEEELKEHLAAKRRKGMSDEEFDDLWNQGIREVEGREEVVTIVDEEG
jgi:Man1-Src1p-C-terminal domain/HeH/LEM domain